MSSFTTPLVVKHMDGKRWMVVRPFGYKSKKYKKIIKVPVGYITDFASIPKFAWSIIGHPAGKYGKAAVIHDFLYSTKRFSRKVSDKIFREGMKVLRVELVKRNTIYYAVRMFGWYAWRNK